MGTSLTDLGGDFTSRLEEEDDEGEEWAQPGRRLFCRRQQHQQQQQQRKAKSKERQRKELADAHCRRRHRHKDEHRLLH